MSGNHNINEFLYIARNVIDRIQFTSNDCKGAENTEKITKTPTTQGFKKTAEKGHVH